MCVLNFANLSHCIFGGYYILQFHAPYDCYNVVYSRYTFFVGTFVCEFSEITKIH